MYVGVIGNENPRHCLSSSWISRSFTEGRGIAGAEVKWGKGTAPTRNTKSAVAENLRGDRGADAADRRGRCSGARMRDSPASTSAYALTARRGHEANPNPWLASKAEFAMAARKTGRTYNQPSGESRARARALRRVAKTVATRSHFCNLLIPTRGHHAPQDDGHEAATSAEKTAKTEGF